MEERPKLHTLSLTQVHKLKKGIGPEYLLNKLKSRNIRRRNDFEFAQAKKKI